MDGGPGRLRGASLARPLRPAEVRHPCCRGGSASTTMWLQGAPPVAARRAACATKPRSASDAVSQCLPGLSSAVHVVAGSQGGELLERAALVEVAGQIWNADGPCGHPVLERDQQQRQGGGLNWRGLSGGSVDGERGSDGRGSIVRSVLPSLGLNDGIERAASGDLSAGREGGLVEGDHQRDEQGKGGAASALRNSSALMGALVSWLPGWLRAGLS